ncbi:xanthine dehydrogenase family protein molybdopterin-binding subunit [Streptomyces collinus]|uniref:Oxidoreductase n=1 Tax=Streptomyces collinus (strain DSM 40733 / Tue 365) TaxID=1214242 RepID=S5VCY2_STRC3|nr:xanthine dehydrogenase family protein molybdopterin-binding subunit [Streptomyces collinus]AGS73069.1 oxidoreductase [Streptomyces collinus Tu 365]UJA11733.1 xanthine dehydrogenase family protein molybdopterin-binding subunit [Streptomyces collinus]UJA13401.1 xanthine dehydrogenase family protein molybdopterin-binding subunit [Streptomyces collinus]
MPPIGPPQENPRHSLPGDHPGDAPVDPRDDPMARTGLPADAPAAGGGPSYTEPVDRPAGQREDSGGPAGRDAPPQTRPDASPADDHTAGGGPRGALGAPAARREGLLKVTGAARYAAEHPLPGRAHAWPVPAAVARGRVTGVDTTAALVLPGVLAVLTPGDAPRLGPTDDGTLAVLQNPRVPHRGWCVALVVAETLETARAAAGAVRVTYVTEDADVRLRPDHPAAYEPEKAGGAPGRFELGDPEGAFAAAGVRVDVDYRVPPLHNHPMEPHATTAVWDGDRLTVYTSTQGGTTVRSVLAELFELPEDRITVVGEHVGGGFGSKGTPRPDVVLAAMAARRTGRPVTLAYPRRTLPTVVGHRAPTLNRLRLGATADGRLTTLLHEVTTHTSHVKEFVEYAGLPARVMYATPHLRSSHRVVPLDVPSPSWMRAPGEAPGMYALESAMDELADALGMDPVELRVRNEPDHEPAGGQPFSSRNVVACLREGARRFGWDTRDPRPAVRAEGPLLLGTGVAAATYPFQIGASTASAQALPDGTFVVRLNAADIGTGARTVLAQVAADALGAPLDRVRADVGRSDLPPAPLAGGSSGTASWGWAVHEACTRLASRLAAHSGPLPAKGLTARADTAGRADADSPYARHAFGAHFAEVAVDTVTGEIRVRRLLGVYAAGRILNARTARSQFVGAMIMGLGMALTEGSTVDTAFGDFPECDLAAYHVPAHADVPDIEADWIEEDDPHLNPMGSKGVGEIGIVGTAAAVGNAVHHATGIRFRELPLTPDRILTGLLSER